MLQDRLGDRPDLLELLFKDRKPIISEHFNKIGVDTVNSWWCRIGDVIFAHPDWFSNIDLRTVVNTQDYFLKEARELYAQTEAIVNGHTHHQGFTVRYHQILMESGSGCERMDYLKEGKKRLETTRGYIILRMEKGKINFNETKFRIFK